MSTRSPFSRRDFIKGAAATAATLAFPTIIPSSALGADGNTAPSERLTIGVIGLGKQGAGHHLMGKLIPVPTFQVVAISDVYEHRREYFRDQVEKKYAELERKGGNSCKGYVDYKEVLARPDIDAVLIATPDHWHTAIVIESCKAKKDIYCEKPLTLTIHEAKSMIDAVRKYDRVFQTGSQQRSEGPFRAVAQAVRNGHIGKIHAVQVALAGHTSKPCDLPTEPQPKGLEWETWLGQAPERGYNHILCSEKLPNDYPFNPGWRDYREFSGGYVTDWGAHHFDITQWALGMDDSGPVEALPPEKQGDEYGAQLVYRNTPAGDEVVVTHVKEIQLPEMPQQPASETASQGGQGNGGNGRNGGQGTRGNGRRGGRGPQRIGQTQNNGILFIGDKGQIFVNREHAISFPGGTPFKAENADQDKVQLYKSPGHHQDWINAIKSRKRPICDVEVGARSVTVCHLANLAYWHGRKLKWDPQKWEFPGDAEANQWRSRERRKPYELPTI